MIRFRIKNVFFSKLPIIIENEIPVETKVLKEGFDLPMNFIIEFEFKLTETNSFESDEEQFIFQGSERFTYYKYTISVIGIFCFYFFSKSDEYQ